MKLVQPIVIKIAETNLTLEWSHFVAHFGDEATKWGIVKTEEQEQDADIVKDASRDAEILIESSGRVCYRSFAPGLNQNVTKIREDSKEYFENILKKGDGSILEHASATFALLNVSRVFTHELVRHRVGTAFSQESLRYVRLDDLPITDITDRMISDNALTTAYKTIEELYKAFNSSISWHNLSFDVKKRVTSFLRRILPQGMATNIIFTANHRTLRWLIEARTGPAAEIEMRIVFGMIAEICLKDFPLIYQDFEKKENPDGIVSYVPKLRSKV